MKATPEAKLAKEEYLLCRQELLLAKKEIILYGVGEDPSTLDRDLLDLSVEVLGEILGYEPDELSRSVVSWQNDTIIDAGFYRRPRPSPRRDSKIDYLGGAGGADLILAYRGGGKSSWGGVVRAIWYIVRDPDLRLGFVSETEDLPKLIIGEIKDHLTLNEDLIFMFGEFRPPSSSSKKWEEKRSTIRQRTKIHREPTFHAFGAGGQSAGYHYDIIFPDDLVTFKGSRTKKVRENLSNWHDSTLGGLEMRHTLLHYLGTPYFPGDLYDRLENGRSDEKTGPFKDSTLSIPAEYTEEVTVRKGKRFEKKMVRKATSPTRLPLDALDRRKAKVGRIHYATQYLMDRRQMVGKVFSLADFSYYDLSEDLREFRSGWARYVFFDLCATGKDVGDYFAGVAIAIAPDKTRIDVIDIIRGRWGMAKSRRAILNFTKKHRAVSAGIEAVQMQIAFAEEIQEFNIIPTQPVPVEKDKVARALKISPQIEAGKVYLPINDGNLSEEWLALYEELTLFDDGDHDDTVDALVGAITLAMYGGAPAAAGGEPTDGDKKDGARKRSPRKLRAKYS